MKPRLLSGMSLALALACGSSNGPTVISVGGTYATTVALTQNNCGAVNVQNNPTTVTHTPGSSSVSLAHAGTSYGGTLSADGSFTTAPVTVTISGSTFVIQITGRFSLTGLEADAGVDVQQSVQPTTCRYVVRWTGTKNGAPNLIP